MSIVIRRTNNEQLRSRKEDLFEKLGIGYLQLEGAPLTREDLADLARLGCLSVNERDLYDELRRVEMLLGEG